MGEMRKFLCQNTNFVTREEKFKSVVRIALWDKFYPYGREKSLEFSGSAGDIRVPVRNKERKMSSPCTPRPSELNDSAACMSLKS